MYQVRAFSLALLCALFAAAAAVAEPAGRELIREGIALHDQGRYAEAVERFERALQSDPHDALALYELANTYFSSRQLDRCVETANKGLAQERDRLGGELGGDLYTVLGSCLSEKHKDRDAIEVFRTGLRSHPHHVRLNYNAAVTYAAAGQDDDAIARLREAIAAEPDYASAYGLLAKTLARQHRYSSAVFATLRFLMAEPASPRSAGAARDLFAHLTTGVETADGKNVTITLGSPLDSDPLGSLEIGRTLAAAGSYVKDEDDEPAGTPAEARVAVLLTFAKIVAELSESDPGVTAAPLWTAVFAPVLALQDRERLETLGFVAAARAGIDGADAWLAGHGARVAELERAIGHAVR